MKRAWFVIAKLLEQFDDLVFGLGHVVSGHTLKHLAAGVAGLVASRMLLRRSLDKTSLGEQRWN